MTATKRVKLLNTLNPADAGEPTKMPKTQKAIFDLQSFEDITLWKEYQFTPVNDMQEALARLGNDAKRVLAIVNQGLEGVARTEAQQKPDGWRTFTEAGEENGPFTGTMADRLAVNALVLTLAKTVFGWDKDDDNDTKKAKKLQAVEMIKSNDAIRAGLQKSAAVAATQTA